MIKLLKRIIRGNDLLYSKLRMFKVYLAYLKTRERNFTERLNPNFQILRPFDFKGKSFFFGYYDKSPWTVDMKHFLLHEDCGGVAKIWVVNPQTEERKLIGETIAFNHQQGAMTQWVDTETIKNGIIFNTVVDQKLMASLVDFSNAAPKFYPLPIQSLNNANACFYSLNYKRLHVLRQEYGYRPEVINFTSDQPLAEDGIWRCNLLESEDTKLIISLEELTKFQTVGTMEGAVHKVNHVITSPDGEFFIFMHRWFINGKKYSRLIRSKWDGSALLFLMGDTFVSHYSWMGNHEIIVYGEHLGKKGYYVIDTEKPYPENTTHIDIDLDSLGDGHPTISPDRKYILTDTYPNKGRKRFLLLYNLEQKKIEQIGEFFAPVKFDKKTRVDLHPRWSPDGKFISIDSAHRGIRESFIIKSTNG